MSVTKSAEIKILKEIVRAQCNRILELMDALDEVEEYSDDPFVVDIARKARVRNE